MFIEVKLLTDGRWVLSNATVVCSCFLFLVPCIEKEITYINYSIRARWLNHETLLRTYHYILSCSNFKVYVYINDYVLVLFRSFFLKLYFQKFVI